MENRMSHSPDNSETAAKLLRQEHATNPEEEKATEDKLSGAGFQQIADYGSYDIVSTIGKGGEPIFVGKFNSLNKAAENARAEGKEVVVVASVFEGDRAPRKVTLWVK